MYRIVKVPRLILTLLVVVLCCAGCRGDLPSLSISPWEVVTLPTDSAMLDIAFADDLKHGWLVGSNATILETTDGGRSWSAQPLQLGGEQNYRLTSVSFHETEGWVVGEPSILLHTTDGGQTWLRIPLSEKLPGAPSTITALGPGAAEMTTNIGAIYQTTDSGRTWQARVEEAVGVLRNISRSPDGKYIAVSSRGNFFSMWEPGQESWTPHNRTSSRRLQNMGFSQDGQQLWLLARGGQVQFGNVNDLDEWEDPIYPESATSWGLLDLNYRTPEEIWVAGGSGTLLCSFDGGQTWQKDGSVADIPSNFYRIIFLSPEQGFVLGQDETLLHYKAESQAA